MYEFNLVRIISRHGFWIVIFMLSLCYSPFGYGQAQSEIDELKALLVETQQSMQHMMEQHQKQMEVLQRRIEDLEEKAVVAQESQEKIEETLMEQDLRPGDDSSILDSNLSLHGYYDFIFVDASDSRSSSFILNELSFFLRAASDDERWTFFSELEFEVFDGDDYFFTDETQTSDLDIETAWLEYSQSDKLQIRVGKLLLPQYWQTYHYPNLTLSTRPPSMVGRIFPQNVIGIQARGDFWFHRQRGISYVAYIGNGGDSEISEVDRNENKAVGGHFTAHLAGESKFDTLDFGISSYSGRDHDDENETVFGLDTQIRFKEVEFLSEFAWGNQEVELEGMPSKVSSDTFGYYLQLGYNFLPRWHAFYRYDELDLYDSGTGSLDSHQNTLGLNFRPRPNISLKLELFRAEFDRDSDPFHGVASAIVYNF